MADTSLSVTMHNTAGAPTAGTHTLNEVAIDSGGSLWRCTVAGTPGTWTQMGASGIISGSGVPSGAPPTGAVLYVRTDTPGVALQRLYTYAAGVWTGIL